MKEIFIKNVVFTDVDGLRGINSYKIMAMYDVQRIAPNGTEYYVLEHRLVDEFTMTWDEIERDGGIAQVNKDLAECYGV